MQSCTIHGGFHPRSNVGRLYIPRNLGGRGLTSVRDCVEEELLNIGKYVIDSSEKLLKVAEEELKFVKRLPTVLVKERKKDRQREWKEKTLHGQFLRETEENENRSRWQWLKAGELKGGKESLICAAQEQALRTNSVAYSTDKTSTTPLCRICKEETESVTHIVSACSNLTKNQYRKRHDYYYYYCYHVHFLLTKCQWQCVLGVWHQQDFSNLENLSQNPGRM